MLGGFCSCWSSLLFGVALAFAAAADPKLPSSDRLTSLVVISRTSGGGDFGGGIAFAASDGAALSIRAGLEEVGGEERLLPGAWGYGQEQGRMERSGQEEYSQGVWKEEG